MNPTNSLRYLAENNGIRYRELFVLQKIISDVEVLHVVYLSYSWGGLPASGKESGFCFMPEVGDEVVFGFYNEDVGCSLQYLGSGWADPGC